MPDFTYFSTAEFDALGYYVYIYSDPETDEPFYVGKGRGNRAFAHLKEAGESAKLSRIAEIEAKHMQPRIEILAFGLDEQTAVLLQIGEQLGVRHDGRVLPAVDLPMRLAPRAEEHHDALPTARLAVREISLIAVTVPVRRLEVLDHDARAGRRQDDVGDVPAGRVPRRSVDLLHDPVAGQGQIPLSSHPVLQHAVHEDPLEGVMNTNILTYF